MKKLIYFFSALAILSLSSCEEVIDVDIPEEADKLAVEGYVVTETDSSYVRLTRTLPYFSGNDIPYVTDAVVEVNGVPFTHTADGVYKPASPYTGVTGNMYNLLVKTSDGKSYSASSFLDPMFQIDTLMPVFKPEEGFIEEGYTVMFKSIDNRPKTKYTYFRFGFKNAEDTYLQDSIFGERILFDNKDFSQGEVFDFELPFLRLKDGDTALLVFRSCDKTMYDIIYSLNNRSNGGGPFSTPPSNLPTNINGGGVGVFAAYDVKRYRLRIQP